ncbi:MAG TPA: S8 family serine peptidase [Actinomycetota bacterium]
MSQKTFLRAVLAAACIVPLLGARSAPAAPPEGSYRTGEALVRFAPSTPTALIVAAHARAGARVLSTIPALGYQRVAFDPSLPLDAVLASYRNDPAVAVAEPNFVARLAAAPDDPCVDGVCAGTPGQWALRMTNPVWDSFSSAQQKRSLPRVTVAVLDTKIDATHPDFANPGSASTDANDGGQLDLSGARDWIPASEQAGAARYHGSYVSGLVAAATNNATGIAAIGHRATILPLTVVNGSGTADAASLADAIVYAWQRGARVINLSLGLTADSAAVRDAIRAVTGGVAPALIVAAAGNNTGSAPFYPGSYPETMSVAGTNDADSYASCSNHNANVSVAAPAQRVVSLDVGGGTVAPPCGTSAAAPQVSGLAALLFEQDPSRSPSQVRSIIERSADDLGPPGRDDRFGHGRINAERALLGGPATTLPRATVPGPAGTTTITASAAAAAGVRSARVFIDSPGTAPASMNAADGSFGGAVEQLSATISVPPSLSAGPHPIYVQAFDGIRWGAKAVGVLMVDGQAPVIAGASASNAIRATGQPVSVTASLGDDASTSLTIGIQVFDAQNRVVFQEARTGVALGGFSYVWHPSGSVLPGTYQVKIIAVDQSGKSSATLVGTIVA